MSKPSYDQSFWEQLWSTTLKDHGDKVGRRPPNAHFLQAVATAHPGHALDAGCGHGAETLWLAAHGWGVTAVDFSASALDQGRKMAATLGPEIAARVEWLEADLGTWSPPAGRFDLVVCIYVHVAHSVEATVRRLAHGVAASGTLLLVGHRPIDPATGLATPAAGQQQVSLEAVRAALDPQAWELLVCEERPRPVVGTGVDAVVVARRR